MTDADNQASETTTYGRDALVEDARTLAATLEDTHPDPYTGHGGRVAFHRHLEELVREVEDGESVATFHRRVQRFTARVRDGHTQVVAPDGRSTDDRLPLDFRVVGDALYVDAVYEDEYSDLLGGRLRAVEGVGVPELRERQALVESSDNEYGDRYRLCDALGPSPGSLASLLDGDTTMPTVTVETTAGDHVERALDLTGADDPVATLAARLDHPETSDEPAYRLLDGGDIALLAIPDCQSHREVLEFAVRVGGEVAEFYDLRETHRRLVGEPVPEDDDEALAALPAATEVFVELAEEMEAAKTETLVVDVRGNTGGSSLAAYALTYVLHGLDGVTAAAGDQYSVSKLSELARRQRDDVDHVEETDNSAGFDFEWYFKPDEESGAATLDNLAETSETFADEVESGDDAGYYCPENVAVVTDAETFSAGLEPAVLLSKLGADVVGVPSAQSANGPRDVLVDELPNTGLTVRVSYRQQVFQPGEDGDVFEPDAELTPDRFESLGRPSDAGVLLALETANAD
jgi:hypothetical protein